MAGYNFEFIDLGHLFLLMSRFNFILMEFITSDYKRVLPISFFLPQKETKIYTTFINSNATNRISCTETESDNKKIIDNVR